MLHTLTRSGLVVTYFTTLLVVAFLGFGPLDAAAGPIYKWVDENGVVTFGSQPPESVPAQPVTVDTYVPPTPDAKADGKTDKKDEKKPEEAKKPAQPEMSAEQKRTLCEQARNDLAALQAHGQIREQDANGNVNYLTDEAKQSRMNADQRDIQQYCQ